METQKINTTIILAAVALIGVMASLLVAGLLADYQRVSNAGSVKAVGVGVYSDSACTTNLTSINWGLLTPGTNYTRDIWIKNLGNTRITLNMATEGWSPATASSYITLWWDREGQYLNATQSFKAVLTLYASTTITTTNITDFSFTIVITGTEAT
ncbi:MAG: hypothetical protein QW166_03395 [Candidatus Bathyarchaeia archaeon]